MAAFFLLFLSFTYSILQTNSVWSLSKGNICLILTALLLGIPSLLPYLYSVVWALGKLIITWELALSTHHIYLQPSGILMLLVENNTRCCGSTWRSALVFSSLELVLLYGPLLIHVFLSVVIANLISLSSMLTFPRQAGPLLPYTAVAGSNL